MASKTGKRRRSKLSLPSGPRRRSMEVEIMPPPPPRRRPRTHDGARDQEGTGSAGTRSADDSASPESAPGNMDDDDYIYPDTDGGGGDDDDAMHVAVGQPAGLIRGRAAEEAARQEELARVLAKSMTDAWSNENAPSGGAAEPSTHQGSSAGGAADGGDAPARGGLVNGGSTCWLNTLIQVASSPRTTLGRTLIELAPGGVSGAGSSETDDDGSSSGETDGDGSSSGSGSGSGGSRSRSSSRSRSRSRSSSGGSGGGSSGGSGSSSYEADDLRRRKGKVPCSNDALGPPNQPVQPVPQNKKRQRAVRPIDGALQELAGTPEEVQKFLRLSTEASPHQLGLCRALVKDGGAGLLSAKHASNGCRIYTGGATSGFDLGPTTIRNILAAASQTRGPVGDMAAVLDGPESTERRRAEEGLRRLRVAAEAGDVVAFLGVCGEIDVSIHIDTTHPAFANSAGRTEPLLVGWGACPKYAESPFYDPDCPLLTGKLWRAAVKASPFGGDAGGAIAALNKNNSCSRSVHDRGGNCFDSKTMPPLVRELSRSFLDLTCTLLLNRFPNVHAVMVLSFGEVCDQGAARHGVVWSGRDDKVGMFASHHICMVPSGLLAATSNFAGLCLLHHAARDREGCRTLEDLGGERRRSAVADAVDALVGAQDFVAPQKEAAAFDGEKEALRAGVEEKDEVFEKAFNAIRTRLGPALFTMQQRSDGGKIGGAADYAAGEKMAGGGVSKGTKRGKGDGGAAKYTAEERGADKSTVELKAQGGEASIRNRKKDPEKYQNDCSAGGANGDRQKKVVAGGKSSGNRRGSEVPFASRLQDIPGVALFCGGCKKDWRDFPRTRGVARGYVDEDNAVVTVMQEKHRKCNKRCKPAAGAKVRIGSVEYTVKSAQDGQFRSQSV